MCDTDEYRNGRGVDFVSSKCHKNLDGALFENLDESTDHEDQKSIKTQKVSDQCKTLNIFSHFCTSLLSSHFTLLIFFIPSIISTVEKCNVQVSEFQSSLIW